MQLTSNGITVSIPDSEVMEMAIRRLHGTAATGNTTVRAIGAMWTAQGGVYAGVVRGDKGQPDYHLIVAQEATQLPWKEAIAWAKALRAVYDDFELPKRKEQSILFGNVPELFEKEYYWSSEQYAPDGDYAWYQGFSNGGQNDYHKTASLRARAVRRLSIESLVI